MNLYSVIGLSVYGYGLSVAVVLDRHGARCDKSDVAFACSGINACEIDAGVGCRLEQRYLPALFHLKRAPVELTALCCCYGVCAFSRQRVLYVIVGKLRHVSWDVHVITVCLCACLVERSCEEMHGEVVRMRHEPVAPVASLLALERHVLVLGERLILARCVICERDVAFIFCHQRCAVKDGSVERHGVDIALMAHLHASAAYGQCLHSICAVAVFHSDLHISGSRVKGERVLVCALTFASRHILAVGQRGVHGVVVESAVEVERHGDASHL